MKNLGNFYAGQTVRGGFNSRSTNGSPITLAGTPALAVYKDGSTTQVTTGITLTVDFDSVTGYHIYEIVTTDAFYTKGSDFRVILTAGTVDSVSVVGVEVGSFSIENRSDDLILKNAFVSTRLPIATVTSQTVFVLTGGPTNDLASVMAIIYDASDADARVIAEGSYVGSTRTLTLSATTGITVTTSDTITLVAISAASTNVNVTQWLGTAVSTPTVPGVPNVNVKTWNDLTTVALPLVPTTPGRTLDVSVGGEAGIDLANVGSPTTVLNLSGLTIKTATDVETDTVDIQSRLPATLVSGRINASVGAMATDTITAASIATDAVVEIADAILSRSVSNIEGIAAEHSLCTVVLAMLENSISSSTLTIKRTDGTTTHVTKTLTTNASAVPITGIS